MPPRAAKEEIDMTTKNLRCATESLGLATVLAVGLALVCSTPASAQQITPGEQLLMLNKGGAVGRMSDSSIPGAPVFMQTPNVTQRRLLWSFSPETLYFMQGGRLQAKVTYKIASVQDPAELLSPSANNYGSGAFVVEARDTGFASRWEIVRVSNLPFFQLRNAWNSDLCMNNPGGGQFATLAPCDWTDGRQWYSLMSPMGALKW
jgi:hypothetical protein